MRWPTCAGRPSRGALGWLHCPRPRDTCQTRRGGSNPPRRLGGLTATSAKGGKRSLRRHDPIATRLIAPLLPLIGGHAARQDRPSLTITRRRDVDPHVLQLQPCAEAAEDLPRPVEIFPSLGKIALRDRHSPQCAPRPAGTE